MTDISRICITMNTISTACFKIMLTKETGHCASSAILPFITTPLICDRTPITAFSLLLLSLGLSQASFVSYKDALDHYFNYFPQKCPTLSANWFMTNPGSASLIHWNISTPCYAKKVLEELSGSDSIWEGKNKSRENLRSVSFIGRVQTKIVVVSLCRCCQTHGSSSSEYYAQDFSIWSSSVS